MTNSEIVSLKLSEDPIDSFLSWLGEAERASVPEPTAMTLATASKEGKPSARIVLYKGISVGQGERRGLRFFTNYSSRKSRDLEENPFAALVFHWVHLGRQIRFEGKVERLSAEESNAYFQSRPYGSQIGAWASPQSQKLGNRKELLELVRSNEEKFKAGSVPCPEFWGGWRVLPDVVEFWQLGGSRLHDRFVYEWNGRGWDIARLAP